MSKVMNIGVLDVRNIQEDLASGITELLNIGVLLESDRSQVLLKDVKKANIGSTVKAPDDLNVITHNGEMKIDQDFLDGLVNPVLILINGKIVFDRDIDNKTLDEKIYSIMANGELICPKKLSGIIQAKGTINGKLTSYKSEYKYFNENLKLNNKFLKSLRPESKLSFKKLIIIEPIDVELLEKKISNIEVLEKIIIVEEYEDCVSQYIDEYYSIEKSIIKANDKEVKYVEENIEIDSTTIKKFNQNVVYIEGNVNVDLSEDINFSQYIELLICNKVICNEETYNKIKNNLGEDVIIEIIEGKLLENTGKMVLTGDVDEKLTIKNMGKLVLDKNLNFDSFTKNIVSIKNYGVIEGPEEKLSIIRSKVKENFGKIKASVEEKKEEKDKKDENVLYANIGELKL